MKKLLEKIKLRLNTVRFTLTFTVTALLLVSIFFVSILSYSRYTKDFSGQSRFQTQQTLKQLSYNISNYLNGLFQLTTYLYNDSAMIKEIEQDGSDMANQLQRRRNIEDYLYEIIIIPRRDIQNVFLIADDIYFSGRMPKSINYHADYTRYDWYQDVVSGEKTVFVPPHLEQLVSYPSDTVFSIVRPVKSIQNINKVIGVIKIDASYEGIYEIAEKVSMGKDGGIFIIDDHKNIIYSSVDTEKVRLLTDTALAADSSWEQEIDGTDYLMNLEKIADSNWTIISVNSLDELTANAKQTRNFTLIFATLSSLFAFIVLLIFTRTFLRPLMQIVQLMKEVRKGNFRIHFQSRRRDEIGYLGDSFNAMVQTINDNISRNTQLATQVYEAQALHAQAQLNALQSQIKPHFLYNTLNMISMQIQLGKSEQAVDNINKLHQLLRGMANWDKEVFLENEYAVLDSYLGIQHSRFGERLEYSLTLEESLAHKKILAFILQPIVENAVIHGMEKQRAKTKITVDGFVDNNFTCFRIEDTGKGMDDEQLTQLRNRLKTAAGNPRQYLTPGANGHIGLENVNNRIKLRYGDMYGISVSSKPGAGTTFIIKLPLLDKEV